MFDKVQQVLVAVSLILGGILGYRYASEHYPFLDDTQYLARGENCIRSFHAFAYNGPRYVDRAQNPRIAPQSPWQAEATNAKLPSIARTYSLNNAVLTRKVGGNAEIWIELSTNQYDLIIPQSDLNREGFSIYRPHDDTFEWVSGVAGDTNNSVVELYVDSNGTVWGRTLWEQQASSSTSTNLSVLTKFNEQTRRFELVEGVPDLSSSKILLDESDIFWIFVSYDAIYRYNPSTSTLKKQTNIVNGGEVVDVSESPDNTIYFSLFDPNSMVDYYTLSGKRVYQFNPASNQIDLISFPDWLEWYPPYSGLLVDTQGSLWLGSLARRDVNGGWKPVHRPYAGRYRRNETGRGWWSAPRIMMESSDGRLWFTKFMDTGGLVDGTGWYDPQTQKGCMFTNYYTNVVEDSNGFVWAVVDGTLYKYDLYKP